MRLHHVSLQAFGPYPTRQDVDVDALAGSGLFLLEGPTGAGKSTILDAVTYALYGSVGSEPGAKDRWRCDFADPGTTPRVTVELSVRGRRLRITRVPEHRRPRRRGEGTTLEASSVHLEELCADAWTTLSTSKAETGELVNDLVGLTRAQFTQVVLLPQGDFARFLRADDDGRRALLTSLFGTHLYDRITAELDRRRARAEQDRRAAYLHIADALSAAGTAAGLDPDARLALAELPEPGLEAELTRLEAQLQAADQSAQVAAELARGRLERADRDRTEAQRVLDLALRVGAARELRARLDAERPEHELRVDELAAARRASGVTPLLAALRRTRDEERAARRELGVCDPSVEPTEADIRELAEAARTVERDAAALQDLVTLESQLPVLRDDVARARADAAALELTLQDAGSSLALLPARVVDLRARRDAAVALASGLDAATARSADIEARHAAGCDAERLGAVVTELHAEWERARAELRAAADEHARLVATRVRGMAGELAAALVPDSPCPVCGSCRHPAPRAPEPGAVSAGDVEAAEAVRDRCAVAASAAESSLGDATRQRDRLVARAGDLDRATLASLLEVARTEAAVAGEAARDLGELDQVLGSTLADLDESRARHAAATTAVALADAEVQVLTDRLGAAESHLVEARGDHPTVSARQVALRTAAAESDRRAGLMRDVLAATRDRQRAEVDAETGWRSADFADEAEAAAAVRSPAELEALAARVEQWSHDLAACRAILEDATLAEHAVDDAEAARNGLRTAQQAHRSAELEQLAATAQQARTARAAATWSECLADLRRARRAYHQVESETTTVVHLAALAKGMDGHRRVALTTFALRHWFGQVVAAANVRLAAMSDGRYELEPSDESESRTGRAGLTLRVLDRYTGERRSTASLSGGETFLASLSLALGLAEVVTAEAGGVSLDTLFIDEGFGSLDEATLDQVMDVVDGLRDRGRVVGIVSHVPELKDRIPERLEVRRRPDGSSFVRVVA